MVAVLRLFSCLSLFFVLRVGRAYPWQNIFRSTLERQIKSGSSLNCVSSAGMPVFNSLARTSLSAFLYDEKFFFSSVWGMRLVICERCNKKPYPSQPLFTVTPFAPKSAGRLSQTNYGIVAPQWVADEILPTRRIDQLLSSYPDAQLDIFRIEGRPTTIPPAASLCTMEPIAAKEEIPDIPRPQVTVKPKGKCKHSKTHRGEKHVFYGKNENGPSTTLKRIAETAPEQSNSANGSINDNGNPHDTIRKATTAPNHKKLREAGLVQAKLPLPYQSFSDVTSALDFHKSYSFLKPNERFMAAELRVGGRLCSIRHMGAILFLSIRSNGEMLQIICQVSHSPQEGNNDVGSNDVKLGFTRERLKSLKDALRMGDIIGAVGSPGRTKKGELSLYASKIDVVAPYVCADQATCPDLKGFTPVVNQDLRYRYRFMDMISNKETRSFFLKRHRIVRSLRDFLDHQGFVEVETPILLEVPSGANAKPFTTYHEGNATSLSLRVAPELHLKQYIVGGIEKVYEIGRVFRNEDADRTHNPEFTTCELYSAFSTYEDLLPFTEDLFCRLAMAANGKTTITVRSVASGGREPVMIDLSKPFRRVSVYEAIEKATGVKLPPPSELQSPRGVAYLSALFLRYDIPLPPVRTASKMFDKLIDYFIVSKEVEPVFIMDHPVCMSPLAKAHSSEVKAGLAERFELFINGVEYCNAYSELNDPEEQFCRFQQQLLDRQCGDKEAMQIDETFLKALQVGMPPTAGWGVGIDRLVALLSETESIRDVIFSPLLRTDHSSHDGKRRRKTAGFFSFSPVAASFVLRTMEVEMRRRGMPSYGCERVRELNRFLTKMHQQQVDGKCNAEVWKRNSSKQGLVFSGSLGSQESSGWAEEVGKMIIRIFCGPATR